MIKNGRIRQSLAYWCLNATDWQWDIHKVCETARSLGCRSVELSPTELWPVVREYRLENAIALNGMPDPVFGDTVWYVLGTGTVEGQMVAEYAQERKQWHNASVPTR